MLGFGVVWWSVATILTPIAARIGLPFLLTMRAFMGIGEVGLFCFFLVLLCFTGLEENSSDKSFGVCVLSLDIIFYGLYAGYRNHFW